MFSYISKALWGDISRDEAKKFGFLSGIFFFIVGSYWMLRELKDALFMNIVGKEYLGTAKIVSVLMLVMLVLFYNKLVDLFEKTHLFYIIAIFYGCLYLGIAYFLADPTIGLANTLKGPSRIFGWFIYVSIESLGSMVVPLFWAYVASVFVDSASAKRGYPLIVSGAQLGSIIGSIINIFFVTVLGLPIMFACAGAGILVVPFMVKMFAAKYATEHAVSNVRKEEKKSTGILEGLRLIFSRNYLMGVLVVSTVYEIVGTIIDLQFKGAAFDAFAGNGEKIAQFIAAQGFCVNMLSFVFALVGTSFLIRRLGIAICLLVYPITLACLVGGIWALEGSLIAFFIAMVMVKGLSYALNNPCKELMYVPTSKDIKFKAKSWIDVQGGRTAKSIGGVFVNVSQWLGNLSLYGSIISLGIIAAWLPVAWWVGKTNQKLVEDNKIIE